VTKPRIAVAIDGPAGAGKSTISRLLAERLGYTLLDTGALYRAVALAARDRAVEWDDDMAVGALARDLAQRDAIQFRRDEKGHDRVLLEDADVTEAIRTPELGQGASRVSALPQVREALLGLQRRAAARGGVVLEGRDIGTVVLPDAEVKFFLTASVEVRAARRHRELLQRGESIPLEEVEREVVSRDARDTGRAVAPLVPALDSIRVESSELSIEEVVERMITEVDRVCAGV
jgi:CMP/dCMP kinase